MASRSNRLAWSAVAALLLVDLIWLTRSAISVAWLSLAGPVLAGVAMAALASFYRLRRDEPKLADALDGIGQMIAFMSVGALFSYLVVTLGLPMRDAALHRLDLSLGLDWIAYFKWLDRNAWLAPLLSLAYSSIVVQVVVLIIVLSFAGQGSAARTMILAMIMAGIVTISISGLLPALSTFAYLGIDLAEYPHLKPAAAFIHLKDLTTAHAGEALHLDLTKAHGIITFPSYHAALGLLALLGGWANRWLRWPFFTLNLLMIAATPIDGGHYFVDVLAGLAIAVASQIAARHLLRPGARARSARHGAAGGGVLANS